MVNDNSLVCTRCFAPHNTPPEVTEPVFCNRLKEGFHFEPLGRSLPAPHNALAWSAAGNRIEVVDGLSARAIRQVANGLFCRTKLHPVPLCGTRSGRSPCLPRMKFAAASKLVQSKDVPPDTFDKAEALLEELRAEALRHRLSVEPRRNSQAAHGEGVGPLRSLPYLICSDGGNSTALYLKK